MYHIILLQDFLTIKIAKNLGSRFFKLVVWIGVCVGELYGWEWDGGWGGGCEEGGGEETL